MVWEQLRGALEDILRELGVRSPSVVLERPRDPAHGDVSTNVAMTSARALGRAPREIAQEIVDRLGLAAVGASSVDIAGPGFLNFRLSTGTVTSALDTILELGGDFGRGSAGGGRPVMVEFVSANPTGPLHLGHGRQAALGDAIAALLEWTGWRVHREFYYNDAGRQVELLTESVRARYLEQHGVEAAIPEGGYQGEYVRDLAEGLAEEVGDRLVADDSQEAREEIHRFAVRVLRADQDRDLEDFRVRFDEHFLESSLYADGLVDVTVRRLRDTGLVYEQEGAVWFRSTELGDQKDRVMLKRDGSATYFLPDVSYHLTKWERGFERVINVQGSDHHGTVARVRAGVRALGLPEGWPEYVLHQMVRVERDGREVKFSKRAGSYTTLRELYGAVGVDVARYFMQMRRPDTHLVFDLEMALDQSDKNPVYKIQYAHARMCSIFAKAGVEPDELRPGSADLSLLDHRLERELVKRLSDFPVTVERAADQASPHVLCDYLEQTAGAANSWYHAGNPTRDPGLAVLVDHPALRSARLALARAVQVVLANGLTILGIDAPRRMERPSEKDAP